MLTLEQDCGCLWAHLAAGSEQLKSLQEHKCSLQPPPATSLPFVSPSKSLFLLSKRSFCSGLYPNKIQIRDLKPHQVVWREFSSRWLHVDFPLPWAPVASTDTPLNVLQVVFIQGHLAVGWAEEWLPLRWWGFLNNIAQKWWDRQQNPYREQGRGEDSVCVQPWVLIGTVYPTWLQPSLFPFILPLFLSSLTAHKLCLKKTPHPNMLFFSCSALSPPQIPATCWDSYPFCSESWWYQRQRTLTFKCEKVRGGDKL